MRHSRRFWPRGKSLLLGLRETVRLLLQQGQTFEERGWLAEVRMGWGRRLTKKHYSYAE